MLKTDGCSDEEARPEERWTDHAGTFQNCTGNAEIVLTQGHQYSLLSQVLALILKLSASLLCLVRAVTRSAKHHSVTVFTVYC